MDTPASAQKAEHLDSEETGKGCEKPFSTALDAGGLFLVSKEDGVAVLAAGATAKLVCFRWLDHHNRLLVAAYRSTTQFRSGDGRLDGMRDAADIPAWIA